MTCEPTSKELEIMLAEHTEECVHQWLEGIVKGLETDIADYLALHKYCKGRAWAWAKGQAQYLRQVRAWIKTNLARGKSGRQLALTMLDIWVHREQRN